MEIRKRNGQPETYHTAKIRNAIFRAFESVNQERDQGKIDKIMELVTEKVKIEAETPEGLSVEQIQDMAERAMMEAGCYEALRSFILYRNERSQEREVRQKLLQYFRQVPELECVLKAVQKQWTESAYHLEHLLMKFQAFYKPGMSEKEQWSALVQAAVELTTTEASGWEMIAARLSFLRFEKRMKKTLESYQIGSFYEKVVFLTREQLYGSYILEHYSQEELQLYETYMDDARNDLFNYSGLELLLGRYVIRNHKNVPLETPQEMFLGIAMHLAMLETKDRDGWVKKFYDMLSTLKVTMATPTLSNTRKPYH